METRANYVIVGIFTVLAVLAAFGFVYWTAGIGERGEKAPLRFRIPGSASGLSASSLVLFNGVPVGNIRRVYLDINNPSVAIADAQVDRLTPITASTRADVGLAGLTGQANIELKGGNPQEQNLLDLAEEQGSIAEITASPSAVTDLLQTAPSVLARADSVLETLDVILSDARGPVTDTVRNVERFSEALARNADGIDSFLDNLGALSGTIGNVSERLDSTLSAAESLIEAVDREQVAKVVENMNQFTTRLNEAGEQLNGIIAGVDETVASINTFAQNANETLSRIDTLVTEVEPESVARAVDNFQNASAAFSRASEDIARVSETVGGRTEDIDRFISDASELASRLNAASVRVDGVLAKLDSLLGSGEGEDLFAEASATLAEFREMAETLNSRVGPITEGLSRFSGKGLREIESLVSEGRRSIARIERAITEFEQNPQRIITGGEGTVRRYDSRTRR
ncbi:MlaD family protein [Chelativorans sp. Marseille-P2723]|uniref:MlaD family protein n=1 Tax=Chelativorans sp. Marseille-P2723 TaxID=2709133 RepID=UPI0015711D2F|nr:MlaD family protein [Chelativorans sp. Marseille-P2723]